MNFLTVITRCFNEPSINLFVEYYLSQGADEIHIIADRCDEKLLQPLRVNRRVFLYGVQNFSDSQTQMLDVNLVYKRIQSRSKWAIFVDCDEFIVARKNAGNSIKDELLNNFDDFDLVKVPWVMFSSHGNDCYKKTCFKDQSGKNYSIRTHDPKNFLISNTFRWNHDKKHPHPADWRKGRCRFVDIEVKCIFKCEAFYQFRSPHFPLRSREVCAVSSIDKSFCTIDEFYFGLREHHIETAYLTCNHYRIISLESCKRKFMDNKLSSYADPNHLNNLIITDYPEVEDKSIVRALQF